MGPVSKFLRHKDSKGSSAEPVKEKVHITTSTKDNFYVLRDKMLKAAKHGMTSALKPNRSHESLPTLDETADGQLSEESSVRGQTSEEFCVKEKEVDELREELIRKTQEYEELRRIVSVDQCKVQETLRCMWQRFEAIDQNYRGVDTGSDDMITSEELERLQAAIDEIGAQIRACGVETDGGECTNSNCYKCAEKDSLLAEAAKTQARASGELERLRNEGLLRRNTEKSLEELMEEHKRTVEDLKEKDHCIEKLVCEVHDRDQHLMDVVGRLHRLESSISVGGSPTTEESKNGSTNPAYVATTSTATTGLPPAPANTPTAFPHAAATSARKKKKRTVLTPCVHAAIQTDTDRGSSTFHFIKWVVTGLLAAFLGVMVGAWIARHHQAPGAPGAKMTTTTTTTITARSSPAVTAAVVARPTPVPTKTVSTPPPPRASTRASSTSTSTSTITVTTTGPPPPLANIVPSTTTTVAPPLPSPPMMSTITRVLLGNRVYIEKLVPGGQGLNLDEYILKKGGVDGEDRFLWLRPDGVLALYNGVSPSNHTGMVWQSSQEIPAKKALVDPHGILKLLHESGEELWSAGGVRRVPKVLVPWPVEHRGGFWKLVKRSMAAVAMKNRHKVKGLYHSEMV